MGLFDRFKKDNKKIEDIKQQENSIPSNASYETLPNGNLQIEFYDENADFKKFYDTTRLIVGKQPLNMEGHTVYNCAVSWYGQDDCQVLDEKTGKFDSVGAQQYRGVLAELDMELLQNDPKYISMVMKGLLDKERVERYLEDGLQENPEHPCGKYIGGVRQTEKGYSKFFSTNVGKASHESELMKGRRQEYRNRLEAQRQKAIEDRKAQIAKLQGEIDNMQR